MRGMFARLLSSVVDCDFDQRVYCCYYIFCHRVFILFFVPVSSFILILTGLHTVRERLKVPPAAYVIDELSMRERHYVAVGIYCEQGCWMYGCVVCRPCVVGIKGKT